MSKRCPFCLKNYKKLTKEHIFPKSWYPDNLYDIEKWKVLSCGKCNARFGKLEQDILIWAGVTFDPKAELTQTISTRVLRSLNPSAGRNMRDRNARLKKVQEVMHKSLPALGSGKRPFPGFGYHEGYPIEQQIGLPVPDGLKEIGKKFIRGIEYKLNNKFIDGHYSIKVCFCDEETIRDVIALIRRGEKYIVAPAIEFYRVTSPRQDVLYEIRMWDKLIIYGYIVKRSLWQRLFALIKV